jgi:hypothetical protein
MENSIDLKCLELAQHFLKDYTCDAPESAAKWMAQRIQKGIEDDLDDLEKQKHLEAKKKVPF